MYFRPRCDFQYLRALMKCSYILNLSTFEGFGLPLLEGMAMGLIPISVKNEGLNEYYDPHIIKIISSTADFDMVIEELKDHNISEVLQSGAKRIASRFSVHNFAESFIREID
jgi:glycosyltransferase involved in cell wall biosynthesis